MKLESSRIRGVLRFKEEVSIPYRDLPPGIVAFVGENGEGKSTALGAALAGAFREFPDRADYNILDLATRPDAFIENVFELEGVGLFRTRLNLDGPHRASDGIIAQIHADGTETILNDGKVSTFDAAVQRILPPKDLLLLSVFSAQNKHGSFGELDRKGRRQRFSVLLGLEHYQEMAERGKTAAGLVGDAIETLAVTRDVLARDLGEAVERELEQRAQQLQAEGGQVEARRVELQRDLTAIEARLAELQEAAAAYAAARTKADRIALDARSHADAHRKGIEALEAHQVAAGKDRDALVASQAKAAQALLAQMHDLSALKQELDAIEQRLAATITDADARVTNNRAMLDQAEAIRSAVKAVEDLDREIGRLRIEQNERLERQEVLQRQVAVVQTKQQDCARAEQALQTAQRDAAILSTVPFGTDCEQAKCQFLTNATAAQAKIVDLQAQTANRTTLDAERASIEAEHQQVRAEVNRLGLRIAELERDKRNHTPTAEKATKLAAAEERITHWTSTKATAEADARRQVEEAQARESRRLADLRQRHEDAVEQAEKDLAAFGQRVNARTVGLQAEIAEHDAIAQRLETELIELQPELDRYALASQQAAEQNALLALRRREWDETTAVLARVHAQVEDLQRQRARVLARWQEHTAVVAQITALQADLVEWQVLAKALGRDGLQTIEIDEAGPAVSKYANELLEASYGSRFTLELVTQEAKRTKGKNGEDMKEVFEVKAYDARDGGEARDIGLLSGGERVIVEEVLRSAIALLVNRRNVQPLRTVWRDESTGALSADNAQRYMNMLRRLIAMGGYHQLIMVTHSADCAMQADAQVRFAGGQLDVVLPPYAEAA